MKSTQKSVTYRCVTVILSAILAVVSLSLTGCSSFQSLIPSGVNQEVTTQSTVGTQASNTLTPSNGTAGNLSSGQTNKPAVLPTYRNPLTGLTSPADLSGVRPVAVCIGNSQNLSAQHGIYSAEILIEAPTEDGSTRLVAITNTYKDSTKIGSLASGRNYLLSLADAFGAVSVYDGLGASGTQAQKVGCATLDARDGGLSTVFYKSGTALFTSGTRLLGAMENFEKCGASPIFKFTEEDKPIQPSGGSAGGVAIPYSSSQVVQFIYYKENGQYMRTQNGRPHTASENGKQLGFTNLLLLVCESSTYNK